MLSGSFPKVKIIRTNFLIPKGYDGLTLGSTIRIRPHVFLTIPFIAHELMHVIQWKRLGFWGFVLNYGWTFFRDGLRYRNIDLEEEARKPTEYAIRWAMDVIAKEM